MLLGKVLDTKYSKEYGNTWKKDFKVLKQIEINPPNALDACSGNDKTGEPDMDEDSDSESEQESSDSDTGDEIKPKSLLDGILTAARSWSTDGRWEKVLNETSELKAHKIVQQTRDPRDTVVGEPPPVKGDLNMANPYSSPAESGNKVNYPAREPHTYIEALHRPLPKHHPQ